MNILYLQATVVPPPVEPSKDRFLLLSEGMEGDILQPVWFRQPEEIEEIFGPGSYPVYQVGRFRYHWFLAYRYQGIRQRLAIFTFYLRTGLRICKERRPACIVAYSHMTTALCAVLVKFLSGTKSVIPEVMVAPDKAYIAEVNHVGIADRLKHLYSDLCLHLTVLCSTRVHLLYPTQLASYPLLRNKPCSVFHDFTPVGSVGEHSESEELYIILAGHPWYRKGVDIAIEAFKSIASDFPSSRLKIVGFFPDGIPQRLAADTPQIEILNAVPHDKLMALNRGAALMLLPSRNEGLPRILLEGLAVGLPLVGSDVAGIPFVIHEGENGFVVPNGNTALLAQRLKQLLSDPALRNRMGRKSLEIAQSFTDAAYVAAFTRMVGEAP